MFLLNVPLAAAALVVTVRHVPESRDTTVAGRLDLAGAGSVTAGLGGIIYALIEAPVHGWTTLTVMALVVGVWALAAFPLIEHRQPAPLIPLSLFHSAQFVGANLVTLAVYTGLGGALFLLALQLQQSLGFTATAAGLSFLPFTVIMLLLSSRIGALAQCIGPRWPMTIGPLVAGGGLALLVRAVPGASYLSGVLPGIAVFGLGMAANTSSAPHTARAHPAMPTLIVNTIDHKCYDHCKDALSQGGVSSCNQRIVMQGESPGAVPSSAAERAMNTQA
jgi:hypothetical protein